VRVVTDAEADGVGGGDPGVSLAGRQVERLVGQRAVSLASGILWPALVDEGVARRRRALRLSRVMIAERRRGFGFKHLPSWGAAGLTPRGHPALSIGKFFAALRMTVALFGAA
jgi:hypothetical protein